MRYLQDLGIAIDDIKVLIFSELLSSPSVGELTRQGFVSGWAAHSATTFTTQKALLNTLVSQLPQPESRAAGGLFRRVYKHTFKIAVPPGSKSLPLEQATEYWKLLFGKSGAEWKGRGGRPWLQWWIGFSESNWKKAVNRDLWDQVLLFEEKTREDESLGWWSEESAWPGVIDEFVAFVKAEKGVGREKDADAMDVE